MRSRAAALLVFVVLSCAGNTLSQHRLLLRNGSISREILVEIASTSSARRIGLMSRTAVPDGTGMLFEYPGEGSWGGIWMKNTRVALDVAFSRRGEIFEIHTLQPCPADPCPVTVPAGTYDRVLEVPGGWLARNGFGTGSTIRRAPQT